MLNLNNLSKQLAFLLRHDKEGYKEGKIDKEGWRDVNELISDHGFNRSEIVEIVKTDKKGRYEFNTDQNKIRAVQGHSIPVSVDLIESKPPDILYHGTSTKFIDSIFKNGIESRTRLYVHLSQNKEVAMEVGKRHGNPVILEINAKKMYEDGVKFFQSKNKVWLVEYVPTKYIKKIEGN